MNYNFDLPTDRRGTYSLKWDVAANELPMWVADMDFETAPEIKEAIQKRAGHGVFGYTVVPEEWYRAIEDWWQVRHHFHMEKEWMIFCTGVVPAISSIVRKMTTVGEKIVLLTPVYNIFFNSIVNNGRYVLECPLRYENGEYSIDFCELEAKLADPQTSMMLFCNPHNPVGKIWDRHTMEKIGHLRHKVWRGLNTDEAAEPNVFAMSAAIAAWRNGAPWLEELRKYLYENKREAAEFLGTQIPEVSLVSSEATYLLWIDCRRITEKDVELKDFLRRETGLYLCEGSEYGKAGEGFLRMNAACPRERLKDGLMRLKRGIEAFVRLPERRIQ